jgi:hypothetical protein
MTRKSKPTNPEHEFALIATGVDDLSDELLGRIYESGCDDATVSMRHGLVYMEFSRRAPSIEKAILSAIRQAQQADSDLRVLRVDECNLVTQAEIARRIGQSRQSVHQYITGARGPGDFPSPACDIDDDNPLYAWCEVSQWFVQNRVLQPQASWNAQVVHAINTWLDAQNQQERYPELVRQINAALLT